jgi:hypothetical protein
VLATADRRFAHVPGRAAGDADAMVEHLEGLAARGIGRAYLWFTDFADEENLLRFGEEVLPRLR